MRFGAEVSPLSVRDVMQRHGGEFWFERDRVRHQAFFRCLLPLADAAGDADQTNAAAVRHDSRPEYYDFDLFRASESQHALDDRPLAELSYTVFDTETTGLEPAAGDEIIQIGAARLVNGKLLRQEAFEQLVDPQRSLPEAGIAIHGIQPEMVRGQPTIDRVLPAFHAYARDTVLVAHNAAFDMRFLQLAEARSGVVFDHPVLDTLLLSAVVHPNQESHRPGSHRRALRRHGDRPPHRPGRRHRHRRGLPEADPAAGCDGHPHPGAGARGGAADVLRAAALLTARASSARRQAGGGVVAKAMQRSATRCATSPSRRRPMPHRQRLRALARARIAEHAAQRGQQPGADIGDHEQLARATGQHALSKDQLLDLHRQHQ